MDCPKCKAKAPEGAEVCPMCSVLMKQWASFMGISSVPSSPDQPANASGPKCPNCQAPRPDYQTPECPKCGVIYAKWYNRSK